MVAVATANPFLIHLQRQRRLFNYKVIGMILLGALLSFLAPFLAAIVLWFGLLFPSWYNLSFLWFFIPLCLILIPLLFWVEIRSSTDDLATSLRGRKLDEQAPLYYLQTTYPDIAHMAALAAYQPASVMGFVEIFVFGPRLVISGYRKWRLARRLKDADLNRAARVLANLCEHADAQTMKDLLRGEERLPELIPTLAYLSFHEWIGVSADGSRVWILTQSRRIWEQA